MRTCGLCVAVAVLAVAADAPSLFAAPNAQQRKELAAIRAALIKVPALLRRKKANEAAKIVNDAETRLEKVVRDGKLNRRNVSVRSVILLLERQKKSLRRVQSQLPASTAPASKAAAVDFAKQVAPLFKRHCLRCHGNNPRGGLNLSDLASIQKGGKSGKAILPGKPADSLLMRRITASGNRRMPKNAAPLRADEIATIRRWISEGASSNQKGSLAKTASQGSGGTVAIIAPSYFEKAIQAASTRKGGLSKLLPIFGGRTVRIFDKEGDLRKLKVAPDFVLRFRTQAVRALRTGEEFLITSRSIETNYNTVEATFTAIYGVRVTKETRIVPLNFQLEFRGKRFAASNLYVPVTASGIGVVGAKALRAAGLAKGIAALDRVLELKIASVFLKKMELVKDKANPPGVFEASFENPLDIPVSGVLVIRSENRKRFETFELLPKQEKTQRIKVPQSGKGGSKQRKTQPKFSFYAIRLGTADPGWADLLKQQTPNLQSPVRIHFATGKETVSFTRDIAPFMVNLCLRCHNDRQKSGGLSLATFEKLMVGGKSGRVVLPGNIDGSRLWDLVGKQQPFKMPRGRAAITAKNHSDLRKWIEEGAAYDGKDAKTPLRSLVPTEEELKAARFAKLSAEEFARYRRKQSEGQWDRVLRKEKPHTAETKEFVLYGNVSEARLKQIGQWAEAHAERLRKVFREKSEPLFKGKLAIFVMKDRYAYEEFNIDINGRNRIPPEVVGHAVVDKLFENAYVVLQDVGDDGSESKPGMKINLIDHLTGAFLQRGGGKLPDWLLRGTGLALAAQSEPKDEYIAGLRSRTPSILRTVQKPESIFVNGTFSPVDVGAVGYTLVEFLLRAGGNAKFGRVISELHRGRKLDAVFKSVYKTTPASLARTYAGSLGRTRRRKR